MRGCSGGLALLLALGCGTDAPGDGSASDSSDDGSSTGEPVVGWFDIGWGDTEFHPLEDGGVLKVVWGGQGAAMFPMPLRAAEFELPDDPNDYTSEKAPMLQLQLDIEGHNDGIGGHFKRIANYPITFTVLPGGTYEYIYLAVLLPDALDPAVLDGLPGHVTVELDPYGSAPITIERDVVIADADPPPV
ncbi:MAG: hypothetical protein IAG13_03190 [Deltaproteobacteria bacterium]|nr:hypothetical protein [Nannocystaceae bacterium]